MRKHNILSKRMYGLPDVIIGGCSNRPSKQSKRLKPKIKRPNRNEKH